MLLWHRRFPDTMAVVWKWQILPMRRNALSSFRFIWNMTEPPAPINCLFHTWHRLMAHGLCMWRLILLNVYSLIALCELSADTSSCSVCLLLVLSTVLFIRSIVTPLFLVCRFCWSCYRWSIRVLDDFGHTTGHSVSVFSTPVWLLASGI